MIKTKCLGCGNDLIIGNRGQGVGYFFGYDTDYYGDTFEDEKDPHEVVGYYCKECGQRMRDKAETIGWERVID